MLSSFIMETKIFVNGIRGKMGRLLTSLMQDDPALCQSENLEAADVAVDFSAPSALNTLLQQCIDHKKPLIVGTTGHTSEQQQALQEMSRHIPILASPNFSLGLAACLEAAELIADRLKETAHVEIIEAHHITKKDQPSGTALALGKVSGAKNIHSIRAGDIIGDHTVLFVLNGERIELKHQVQSREAFARGALLAAKFLKTKPPGLYSMKDLL
jgi:4-hydroxy-tetrahydrodipicolinate reductase